MVPNAHFVCNEFVHESHSCYSVEMSKKTKSAMIRELYRSGKTKPAEIVAALEGQGVATTANYVSTVLSKRSLSFDREAFDDPNLRPSDRIEIATSFLHFSDSYFL